MQLILSLLALSYLSQFVLVLHIIPTSIGLFKSICFGFTYTVFYGYFMYFIVQ